MATLARGRLHERRVKCAGHLQSDDLPQTVHPALGFEPVEIVVAAGHDHLTRGVDVGDREPAPLGAADCGNLLRLFQTRP